MSDQDAGYYAVIPADVRYDNDLTPNAKLLYGEITALCKKEGYCWATNKHFADLYQTSEKTISRWIANLEEKGYIGTSVRTFRYDDGTVKKVRYIYLDKNKLDHMDKNVQNHMDKSVSDHPDENVPYNNKISNNKISKNKGRKVFIPPTVEEVQLYCKERSNKVDAENFIDYYTARGWKLGKETMKDWKAAVRTWERKEFSYKRPNSRIGTAEDNMNKDSIDIELPF